MSTIVRRLGRNLRDPGSLVSVIIGVFVGALLGGDQESRAPTHTVPARGRERHPGDRDAYHSLRASWCCCPGAKGRF